uniref:Envelope protein n=1 Tax=Apis Nora virus TaxID=1983571 RepID=A0A1W6R6I2_9VIRU|nr:envelope protein [Apis Nora virus]
MALKEEIFDQNTTLFAVLDENEVTELAAISGSVNRLETQLDEYKLQLDGLARLVDQYQARNESQFVDLNTQIVTLNSDVSILTTRVSSLANTVSSLQTTVEDLDETTTTRFSTLNQQVDNLAVDVSSIQTVQNNQTVKVENLNNAVAENAADVANLEAQVNTFEARIADLETMGTTLARLNFRCSTGPMITSGTVYVWQYQYGRLSTFEYTGVNPMMIGYGYTVNMSGWLNGQYDISVETYDPNVNNAMELPLLYSIPVASGTIYRFRYGASQFVFAAYIYQYEGR